MSQELQDYIAQARKVEKSDEEIVKELLDKGWKHSDITAVLTKQNAHSFSQKLTKKAIIGLLAALGIFGILFTIQTIQGISSWNWTFEAFDNDKEFGATDSEVLNNEPSPADPSETTKIDTTNKQFKGPAKEGWVWASELSPFIVESFGIDFQYPSSWELKVDGLSKDAYLLFLNSDEDKINSFDRNAIHFYPAQPIKLIQIEYPEWNGDITQLNNLELKESELLEDKIINNKTYKRLKVWCDNNGGPECSTSYGIIIDKYLYRFYVREKNDYANYNETIHSIIESMIFYKPKNNFFTETLKQIEQRESSEKDEN